MGISTVLQSSLSQWPGILLMVNSVSQQYRSCVQLINMAHFTFEKHSQQTIVSEYSILSNGFDESAVPLKKLNKNVILQKVCFLNGGFFDLLFHR